MVRPLVDVGTEERAPDRGMNEEKASVDATPARRISPATFIVYIVFPIDLVNG